MRFLLSGQLFFKRPPRLSLPFFQRQAVWFVFLDAFSPSPFMRPFLPGATFPPNYNEFFDPPQNPFFPTTTPPPSFCSPPSTESGFFFFFLKVFLSDKKNSFFFLENPLWTRSLLPLGRNSLFWYISCVLFSPEEGYY